MRACSPRSALTLGSLLAALALPAGLVVGSAPLFAQTAAPAGKDAAAPAAKDAPKQVALTQAKIDSLVAAQKKIQDIESKAQPKDGAKGADQADAKTQKEVEGAITSSGFSSMKDFADTMYSVGMVLSGIDPDGNEYIGSVEALKKEEAQVKADKKMPANEKKEVLDEIEAGIKTAPTDKPMPGNIEIVKANMGKLDQSQKAD